MKRLEGVHNKWLRNSLVTALGGFSVPCRDTRVLFCKDTFDYPDLEGHELLCNHLAPKINLRSKKKKKKQSTSPGETDSNESESSLSTISSSTKVCIFFSAYLPVQLLSVTHEGQIFKVICPLFYFIGEKVKSQQKWPPV